MQVPLGHARIAVALHRVLHFRTIYDKDTF